MIHIVSKSFVVQLIFILVLLIIMFIKIVLINFIITNHSNIIAQFIGIIYILLGTINNMVFIYTKTRLT